MATVVEIDHHHTRGRSRYAVRRIELERNLSEVIRGGGHLRHGEFKMQLGDNWWREQAFLGPKSEETKIFAQA